MSEYSRRKFLASTVTAGAGALIAGEVATGTTAAGLPNADLVGAAVESPVEWATYVNVEEGAQLRWLDGVAPPPVGSSLGVAWPRGQVAATSGFALRTEDGGEVPVQSWPLAYWPDGTAKWTGHTVGADIPVSPSYRLIPTAASPVAPATPVTVSRSGSRIQLSNGLVDMVLSARGEVVIVSLNRAGRLVAGTGRLVLLLADRPDGEVGDPRQSNWTGVVDGAVVEQSGPVRAVVRLTGTYRQDGGQSYGTGGRRILPWTLRVYLTAGESVRLVHHFEWNADPSKDFVRGLGLRLSVPLTDEAHNRHVRFGTAAGGVWAEPVRVLTGLRRDPGAAVRAAQVAGTATPPVEQWSAQVAAGYQQLALWNDFTLSQDSANQFAVWKRTSAAGRWLTHAGRGEHASGFGYVGGVSGGLGFGLTDFWQRHPRGLDVRDAAGPAATVTMWSYSPYARAMDLRHYDTVPHGLDLSYEDVQAGFSTPEGVVRSTEMRLWAFAATPSRDVIVALAPALTAPPQLIAAPAWLHAAGVFGRWSLPDRSTPARTELEDSIDRDVAFYAGQVWQRRWYGFWDYGDIMHTYDADRHEWRYDVGGYAWDNAELGSDAALWYAFLRTGRADIFRLARAMTQHVSEVDTHHSGRFAGLGSRHNVSHWGDGAKEARIGESLTRRFAYYLTADELLGDLLRSSLQADRTLLTVEPLREVLPPQTLAPTRLRIGPDWYALVSNWLTEWERTGDTRWRDRIVAGMTDIASFPAGLFTGEAGGAVGFDPTTGHLTNLSKGDFTGGYNLAMAFGGEQVLWEALSLVDVPAFRTALLDFARYVQAPSAEKIARYGFDFNPNVFRTIYSRVTAWAGEQLDDVVLRRRGWAQYLADPAGRPWPAAVTVTGNAVASTVDEIPKGDFATNDAAQRILAIISLLAVAPQEAP